MTLVNRRSKLKVTHCLEGADHHFHCELNPHVLLFAKHTRNALKDPTSLSNGTGAVLQQEEASRIFFGIPDADSTNQEHWLRLCIFG